MSSSLHQLLGLQGGGDCAGSDEEVCIGNDSPPVGSTSFPPQEHQVQGAGDHHVGRAMDATLLDCCSPDAQSKDGSDGDVARALRQAAEERRERETPGTTGEGCGAPTTAARGAAAPAPEASGQTPTASRSTYRADTMAARLAAIPLEGQTVEDVAKAVVIAYREEGIKLAREDSKKSKGAGARVTVVGLACKHGMKNRQAEYRQADAANGIKRRKSVSQRTGCPFKVFIRWPVRGDKNEHPYLSEANVLEHNHTVEKANRRLLYAEMLKKITAAVNSGVQTVPAETLRAIVEAFERNIHAAAMTSSG